MAKKSQIAKSQSHGFPRPPSFRNLSVSNASLFSYTGKTGILLKEGVLVQQGPKVTLR